MVQNLVHECNEQSLKLEEIPGLLAVKRVKSKQLTKSTLQVTQVHRSMEGKDVINMVRSIKEWKEKIMQSTESHMKKKGKEKLDFYRCKSNRVCNTEKCLAAGLKECPSCHSILRSVYSEAACRMDSKKPDMIFAAAALKKGASKKLKYHIKGNYSSEEEESENASLKSFDESESDTDLVDESDMTMEIPEKDESQSAPAVSTLQHVWKSLESLTPEDQKLGK